MRIKRPRIKKFSSSDKKREIQYSTAFMKSKYPNWDERVKVYTPEQPIRERSKPAAASLWDQFKNFAAAELATA